MKLKARTTLSALALPLLLTLPATSMIPTAKKPTPVGDRSICRGSGVGSCLTRNDNGVVGRGNLLWFSTSGVHLDGGYWTIEHVGWVRAHSRRFPGWPFTNKANFNSHWATKEVVQIAGYTYQHQFAASECERGLLVSTCQENKSDSTYWVAVHVSRSTWQFISVRGTDEIFKLTGKNNTYMLEEIGAGRRAVLGIHGDVTQLLHVRSLP